MLPVISVSVNKSIVYGYVLGLGWTNRHIALLQEKKKKKNKNVSYCCTEHFSVIWLLRLQSLIFTHVKYQILLIDWLIDSLNWLFGDFVDLDRVTCSYQVSKFQEPEYILLTFFMSSRLIPEQSCSFVEAPKLLLLSVWNWLGIRSLGIDLAG